MQSCVHISDLLKVFVLNGQDISNNSETEKNQTKLTIFTGPFNNMRTLKSKAQPANAFFAAIN